MGRTGGTERTSLYSFSSCRSCLIPPVLLDRPADPALPAYPANAIALEVDRDVEPREPRVEERRRSQPRGAVRGHIEGLLERGAGVRVEEIVEVESDIHAVAIEANDLGQPHVE